jgi:hypothetical protein
MDEPAAVGLIERGGDLAHYPQRLIGCELAIGLEHAPQVAPLHVAHREVELLVVLARLVDRHHVRVVERRRQPWLVQKALAEALVLRELGSDQLERHRAVQ